MTTKYPLKLIEWHDAYNGDHSWVQANQLADKAEPLVIQTLGFEVRRDNSHLTLAMSITDNERLCDLFTIPLAVVVREQTFRSRQT